MVLVDAHLKPVFSCLFVFPPGRLHLRVIRHGPRHDEPTVVHASAAAGDSGWPILHTERRVSDCNTLHLLRGSRDSWQESWLI